MRSTGHSHSMDTVSRTSRRELLNQMLLVSGAAAAVHSCGGLLAGSPPPGQLPQIKLGALEVSRLILGSNPFWGFAHRNPQATDVEMKAYYTDEQIMAVLDAAAAQGITAVWSPSYPRWINLWNKYRGQGGKLKIWIGQPDAYGEPLSNQRDAIPRIMRDHITAAAKNGAKAICVQGAQVESQFRAGRFDVLRDWLELIKSFGLPAGLAAHDPRVHLSAEEKGLPTDFYHQCLFRSVDNAPQGLEASLGPLETSLATIEKIAKPVIAYKVLCAGRILPKDAFPYVLSRLKPKDGMCVGVFPKKKDESAENAELVRQLSKQS